MIKMKAPTLLILILTLLIFDSCKNQQENKITEEKTAPVELESEQNKTRASIEFPIIETNLTPSERKNKIEGVLGKINERLPEFEKKSKSLTLNEIQNTPVDIWYQNGIPIKIEHGVTDDSGEFSGKFTYYLNQGKIWYSEQIYARYLFENDALKYWMDEGWNINEIPSEDMKTRGDDLTRIISYLVDEMKKQQ
jgi:hypothetical protein